MNNKKQASGHHLSGHLGALSQEPWMMNTYRFLVFLQYHMSSVDTQRGDLNPLIRKRPSFLPSSSYCSVFSCLQSVLSVYPQMMSLISVRFFTDGNSSCDSPASLQALLSVPDCLFLGSLSTVSQLFYAKTFLFTINFTVSLYKMPVKKYSACDHF